MNRWSNFPPFYEFLSDGYFDGSRNRDRQKAVLETLSPHELYASYEGYISSKFYGIGKKGEQNIRSVINDWKPFTKGQFCKCCDEPLLDWYGFCPLCGKEV